MDKLKAIFRRKKDTKPAADTKAGTNGTAAAAPKPTPADTAAAPSTSDPTTAPAGEWLLKYLLTMDWRLIPLQALPQSTLPPTRLPILPRLTLPQPSRHHFGLMGGFA